MMKTLIAYFSYSNNTKKLVTEVNRSFSYDVVRIERVKPYSDVYEECAYVDAKNEVQKHIHPQIKPLDVDFSDYDRILLFFPIWWYTFPMPVGTFLEGLKGYQGEVILFANSYSNDPQYMVNSLRDAKTIDSSLDIKEGLFNKDVRSHIAFLNK